MEEDMLKKRKFRALFEKLLDPSTNKWRLVDYQDVFSLPPLPPGKSEHLVFDPLVIAPNDTEHTILDAIWDREMHDAFRSDLQKNKDWKYGSGLSKEWKLSSGLTSTILGMTLLIRADNSARSLVVDEIGFKLMKDELAATVAQVCDFVAAKWPHFSSLVPGQELVRRFIANCRFSPENEALLSQKLTRCILPGNGGRRMANDEKGAKFTGNSSDVLAANKPEGKEGGHLDCRCYPGDSS
jgi:hypothetical protein